VAVDLADYTDTLRREVSPPGSTTFAAVADDVLVGYLTDAFWEVKLDGFVEPWVADIDGVVIPASDFEAQTSAGPYTPTDYDPAVDMPRDQVALVVLYAGIKILRNNLISTNTRLSARAGPVEFTTENSANVMTEMLRELTAIKDRLLALKTMFTDVSLIDAFSGRSFNSAAYGGYVHDVFTDLGAF
jgi:hypothetical protein